MKTLKLIVAAVLLTTSMAASAEVTCQRSGAYTHCSGYDKNGNYVRYSCYHYSDTEYSCS